MLTATFPVTNQVVRHKVIEGEPWFHVSDVCKALNLGNSREIANRLEQESKRQIDNESSGSDPWFMDEEALYTVVLRCRDAIKPGTVAYKFRKWVIEVIKTIRKTGQYTATESDQQYFEPFGIILERKIGECDRAIAAATVGEGKIPQLAKDRSVLEKLYRETPKAKAEDMRIKSFIAAYRDKFGDNEFMCSELARKVQAMKSGPLFDAVKDICFVCAKKQFDPGVLGKFLQSHREVVVDGWKIQKLPRSSDGQRWAVVKA